MVGSSRRLGLGRVRCQPEGCGIHRLVRGQGDCYACCGQSGSLSQWVWGFAVTVTFLLLVAAVFRLGVALGPWDKDERGEARPLWKRHGFWLVAIASLLYLPTLGSYSLWDPWETHYGEVARQMNERGDYISLWWPGSPKENRGGEFWSKPVLTFWAEALSMKALGLGDARAEDEMVRGSRAEWACRLPSILFGALAGVAILFLEQADEFVVLAAHSLQVVVGELAPPLLDVAPHFLPLAFEHVLVHVVLLNLLDDLVLALLAI